MATGKKKQQEVRLDGLAVSPGIAIGPVYIKGSSIEYVEKKKLAPEQVESEIEKFRHAIENAKVDIECLKENAERSIGEDNAKIFDAHRLMLEDEMIVDQTIERIKNNLENADYAFSSVVNTLEARINSAESDYLKSRSLDLFDIKRRVVGHILGSADECVVRFSSAVIVVARELTPSDTVSLDRTNTLAFAVDLGGQTSHAAIMARALKVPSVVGLGKASKILSSGDEAILDGINGTLILYPREKTKRFYRQKLQRYHRFEEKLSRIRNLPARTKDGKDIELVANIEFPEEAESIHQEGAQGVGLYRTEYLFLTRSQLPTEEEQFQEYKRVIDAMKQHPITIRTLDIGGDKKPSSIQIPEEENPFLGLRGIRLYKDYEEMINTQLRAILRASVYGHVRILFPMINSVSEMRQCKALVEQVAEQLGKEQLSYQENISIGAMIEVPSSAIIADYIAAECDFLSVGTNDLIQYTLAVDRGNEHVAYLYQGYHPAILRLIRDIVEKGHQQGVWVGMCGELAGDPLITMVLIGLGLDEFSVSPISVPLIKEIIRRVEYTECESFADRVLGYTSVNEVSTYLHEVMNKKFKDLFAGDLIHQ